MSAPLTRELRLPRLRAEARFEPATLDAKARTVELRVYSGAAVDRFPLLGEPYRLSFDLGPKAVRLERLNAGAPLKLGHASDNDLHLIAGVIDRAWLAKDGVRALARFSSRPDVEPFFQDVRESIIRNVSMEAIVHELRDVTEKGDSEKHLLAVDWEPAAVALIGVPADPGAQTLSNQQPEKFPCRLTLSEAHMDDIDATTDTGTDDSDDRPKTKAELKAENAELKRQAEAHRIAKHFKCGDLAAQRWINEGLNREEMYTDAANDRARRAPVINPGFTLGEDYDAGPRLHERMAEGLSATIRGVEPSEMGRQFHGLGFTGVARELARRQRRDTWLWKGREGDARAVELALTTSDYPAILGDSARRTLLPRYEAAMPTYRQVCGRRNFQDFRQHSHTRAGDFPVLLLTGEAGEIKHGSFGENKEPARLYTYARLLSFSRQALVNDDLGAFQQVMNDYGQRIADLENGLFFALLTSGSGAGPTMSDTGAFFNATAVTTAGGHANLTSSGTAISDTTLTTGAAMMQRQQGLPNTVLGVMQHEGVRLNLQPKFLLAAPEKRALAFGYTSTNYTPAAPTSINTFAGVLQPLLDANLTGNRWYLFTDPAVLPAFVYGSLDSEPGPRVATKAGFEVEGLMLRVAIDFGVSALEWRSGYSNAGA